ncbi:MAG: YkgJ family cysteine cluster protein [Planctomycetes bacterium]|jgi:hypothetical protein|nr:YkgJ family cysteine cluster protein [Planctomycetota bacterium]
MSCGKCGACRIAPSIASTLPNMPGGKPAGTRGANLTDENLCRLYGIGARPAFCYGWPPLPEVCGTTFEEATAKITALDHATAGKTCTPPCRPLTQPPRPQET